MSKQPAVVLPNGRMMPAIGYGTSHNGGYSSTAVAHALQAGYWHIDTATRYGCEAQLGEDIEASGIERGQLFLTSKLWPSDYGSKEKVTAALNSSLAKLRTSYLDLYLMHWPGGGENEVLTESQCLDMYRSTWSAMEEMYKSGVCRAIGVSNFEIRHLKRLFTICSVFPMVNQIEFHPYFYDAELLDFCHAHNILVQGYCVLAKGVAFREAELREPLEVVGRRYGKSPGQVMIRWCLQHDVVPIMKSLNVHHLNENADVFDFVLSDEDMRLLDGLSKQRCLKVSWDPREVP